MTKTILSLGAAAALAIGGMTAASQPAHAYAWWVIPAIVGGTVVGVGTGAAIANANNASYTGPRGQVYVEPTAACHIERVQSPDGVWRRTRVCG